MIPNNSSCADSIELLPGPMRIGQSSSALGVEIQAAGSQRIIKLGFPAALRRLRASDCQDQWSTLCQYLKNEGWLLRCSADDLSELAATQIPLRLGHRVAERPFDSLETQTADLIELECRVPLDPNERSNCVWQWPQEVANVNQMAALVAALRGAAGFSTPIGLTLALGNIDDLRAILSNTDDRPDFITLVDSLPRLSPSSLCHLATARRLCHDNGAGELPIFLEAGVHTPRELIVCLCLGATVVSLDSFVQANLSKSENKPTRASSLINSLGGTANEKTAQAKGELETQLEVFKTEFLTSMHLVSAASTADLNPTQLATLDSRFADACGIATL